MAVIRNNRYNVLVSNPALDRDQIYEIKLGLKNGLDFEQIRFYADVRFNSFQMAQIRAGFESQLSWRMVELYAKPEIDWREMKKIRLEFSSMSFHSPENNLQEGSLLTSKETDQSNCVMIYSCISAECRQVVERRYSQFWSAWEKSNQIFIFDYNLASYLWSQSDAVEQVSCEILLHLPYKCVCIVTGNENRENPMSQFFVWNRDHQIEFIIVAKNYNLRKIEIQIRRGKKIGPILERLPSETDRSIAKCALQLYLSLCIDQPLSGSTYQCKAKNIEPYQVSPLAKQDVNRPNVFFVSTDSRTDKNSRNSQKSVNSCSRHCPHKRKAHWHHYWIGSRTSEGNRSLILKWIPEINVHATESPSPRIVIVRDVR